MKQIIVMRKDLNMRKGKMIAQGAHASMKAYLDFQDHAWVYQWLNGRFTKIAVSVDSLAELQQIYNIALARKVPKSWIIDAGLTEFDGVPTPTCCAIGPAPVELIDEITGHLKLL